MQNYFNDTAEVLQTTENLIRNDILANQTALIENPRFFEMTSYSPYEFASNLYKPDYETPAIERGYDYKVHGTPRDFCEENDIEPEDEIQEPLEWWLVSKWLHDELESLGFVTLDTDWGYYWGRTTSGQAIELDNVIQEVARKLNNEIRQLT